MSKNTESNCKSVWQTLSVIDCTGHTEEKGGFTYLSWSWAWQTLKENYPLARFEKQPIRMMDDGTCFVVVRVWIRDGSGEVIEDVSEYLPVLDYKNKAIQNPNAFDINSAYQRCLVKCLAYMGLGMYIYQGLKANPDHVPEVTVIDINGEAVVTTDWATVASVLTTFIERNDSDIDALRKYWALNKEAIDHLKQYAPDEYQKVLATFTAIADSLKGESK